MRRLTKLAVRWAGAASTPAALVAASFASFAGVAGCDTYATGSHFVDRLTPSLTEKLGEISSLTCPERILIQNTTVFRCEVVAASGRSGTIKVTLDFEGGLKWETE